MTNYVKAYIEIENVPEWQIDEEVTVYFKDTMCIKGVCREIPTVDIATTMTILNIAKHKCLRCGRTLKNPDAQERGYGEVCWKKHLQDNQKMLF